MVRLYYTPLLKSLSIKVRRLQRRFSFIPTAFFGQGIAPWPLWRCSRCAGKLSLPLVAVGKLLFSVSQGHGEESASPYILPDMDIVGQIRRTVVPNARMSLASATSKLRRWRHHLSRLPACISLYRALWFRVLWRAEAIVNGGFQLRDHVFYTITNFYLLASIVTVSPTSKKYGASPPSHCPNGVQSVGYSPGRAP